MGSSGIGKSTLMHMLAGIESPTAGFVTLGGSPIHALSSQSTFFQNEVSCIFQQPYLLPELTVVENVMLKDIASNKKTKHSEHKAVQLLASINLESKAYSMPTTLSGGQQQRVALLRAIFTAPQFLLADEPTGNLDDVSGKEIIDLLLNYKDTYGMGLIVSTHDQQIAQRMDHVLRVEDKKFIIEK